MSRRTLILSLIALLILLAGIVAAGLLLRVKEVRIGGHSHYSPEEIEALFFEEEGISRSPLVILYKKLFKGWKIPQLESYDVSFDGLKAVNIQVKEKKLYGYVPHLGSNLFFDKEGVVVKSSSEVFKDVIKVSGLQVEAAVLNEPLQVENEKNFKLVATVIDFISSNQIKLDNVSMYLYSAVNEIAVYNGSSVSMRMGDITVLLGKNVDMQEKLMDLIQMLPEVWGKGGTLHMEDYAGADTGHIYYFEEK